MASTMATEETPNHCIVGILLVVASFYDMFSLSLYFVGAQTGPHFGQPLYQPLYLYLGGQPPRPRYYPTPTTVSLESQPWLVLRHVFRDRVTGNFFVKYSGLIETASAMFESIGFWFPYRWTAYFWKKRLDFLSDSKRNNSNSFRCCCKNYFWAGGGSSTTAAEETIQPFEFFFPF